MKALVVDILISVLRHIWAGGVRWFFQPKKWADRREKDRKRWYKYHLKAQATTNYDLDDRIAASIAAGYKFRTLPGGTSLEDQVQHLLGQAIVAHGVNEHDDVLSLIKAANTLLAEHK